MGWQRSEEPTPIDWRTRYIGDSPRYAIWAMYTEPNEAPTRRRILAALQAAVPVAVSTYPLKHGPAHPLDVGIKIASIEFRAAGSAAAALARSARYSPHDRDPRSSSAPRFREAPRGSVESGPWMG